MRPAVTVVLVDELAPDALTRWVAMVLQTLGPEDDVVVVGDVSLPGFGELRQVQVPPHAARAARLNAATAAATTELLVLLAGGAVVCDGWLESLAAPFADPLVVAAGPVLNVGNPVQRDADHVAPATAADDGPAGTEPVNRLDEACLVLRREAVERAGGCRPHPGMEVDDLCRRLSVAGHDLVVVRGVRVHVRETHAVVDHEGSELERVLHVASTTREEPLLSASLIVKNEAEDLPACLASLREVVDEVVVYDTGSTDDTVAIARAAGAVVIEGYWDDDFARARNASLDACTGEWILAIDADEVATGDPAVIRALLAGSWSVDVFAVVITNLVGTKGRHHSGMDHHGPRLLRRARCRWAFRLHEQPTPADGLRLRPGEFSPLRLLHSGYLSETASEHDKVERNIRVAEEALRDPQQLSDHERSTNLVNLGRSYSWACRFDDALACYTEALDIGTWPTIRRAAISHGIDALFALGQLDEVAAWIAMLKDESTPESAIPRFLEAQLLLRTGSAGDALQILEGIDALETDNGEAMSLERLAAARATACIAVGDWERAVASLMVAATTTGSPAWAALVEAVTNAGGDLAVVAALASEDQLLEAVGQVQGLQAGVADEFLERLWVRFPGSPRVLGGAVRVAVRLPILRALEWSIRLRNAGTPEFCPLRAITGDDATAPGERLRAGAVLEAAFSEPVDRVWAATMIAAMDAADLNTLLIELQEVAPELALSLVPENPPPFAQVG